MGEYGVLCGGPILVAAVDLYATATTRAASEETEGDRDGDGDGDGGGARGVLFASASEGIEPFHVPPGGTTELDSHRRLYASTVSSTLSYLSSRGATVAAGPVRIDLDTSAFQIQGDTLGLGSTGASAVAIAGALFEAAGLSVEGPARQWDLLTLAAHTQSVVRGPMASGSDVAAAAYGGMVVYRRGGGLTRTTLPKGVHWTVIRSPGGIRTGSMMFRAPGDSGGGGPLSSALGGVAAASERVVERLDSDPAAFLAAVVEFRKQTEELGDKTGVATTTPGLRKIIECCDAYGVVAKPTPTDGEGDLGLLLSPDETALAEALKECNGLGFHRLDLRLDPDGVRAVGPEDR